MSKKTELHVFAVLPENPASGPGMMNVGAKLAEVVPNLGGGHFQKTTVFGDQLFYEKGCFS